MCETRWRTAPDALLMWAELEPGWVSTTAPHGFSCSKLGYGFATLCAHCADASHIPWHCLKSCRWPFTPGLRLLLAVTVPSNVRHRLAAMPLSLAVHVVNAPAAPPPASAMQLSPSLAEQAEHRCQLAKRAAYCNNTDSRPQRHSIALQRGGRQCLGLGAGCHSRSTIQQSQLASLPICPACLPAW